MTSHRYRQLVANNHGVRRAVERARGSELDLEALFAHPILDPDRERDLLVLAHLGNRAARDLLVLSNQRLIWKLAKKRSASRACSREDLLQAGSLGLMRAIELWQPHRALRLSTYAIHWIRQSIQREQQKLRRTVRLPNWLEPLAESAPAFLSLDARSTNDGEPGDSLSDGIESPHPEPEEDESERKVRVATAVESLPKRHRQVLELRCGLGGAPTLSLDETAIVLRVSRAEVRHRETLALKALERALVVHES